MELEMMEHIPVKSYWHSRSPCSEQTRRENHSRRRTHSDESVVQAGHSSLCCHSCIRRRPARCSPSLQRISHSPWSDGAHSSQSYRHSRSPGSEQTWRENHSVVQAGHSHSAVTAVSDDHHTRLSTSSQRISHSPWRDVNTASHR